MTEVQIRDALAEAKSYPELFSIVNKLREQGAKETTLNRCVKDRRNQLLKCFRNLVKLKSIPINNTLISSDSPFVSCDIIPQDIYGNVIELKTGAIILR